MAVVAPGPGPGPLASGSSPALGSAAFATAGRPAGRTRVAVPAKGSPALGAAQRTPVVNPVWREERFPRHGAPVRGGGRKGRAGAAAAVRRTLPGRPPCLPAVASGPLLV